MAELFESASPIEFGIGYPMAEERVELSPSRKGAVNWIDAHPEFGIGRPYLDKDPAHVAPIDGKEYADHRKPKSAMRLLAKISHTLMTVEQRPAAPNNL